MTAKRCACCGGKFQPCPQVPDQTFCSSADCQRTRKRLWQKTKLRNDQDYRENQRAAQRSWQDRNPDYWRRYSRSQVASARKKCRSKMDASEVLSDGLYFIRRCRAHGPNSSDLWVIEAVSIGPAGLRKMDVSREDLIDDTAVQP